MLSKQLEELNNQKLKLSNRQLSIKENFIKNKNEKYEKIQEIYGSMNDTCPDIFM